MSTELYHKLISPMAGDPSKMEPSVILLYERVRFRFIRDYDPEAQFFINCGYQDRTSGQHPEGTALDFRINSSLSFPEQVLAIQEILDKIGATEYVGLGIYPDWIIFGDPIKPAPGFHMDTRGVSASWGRIDKRDEKGNIISEEYVSLAVAYSHAKTTEEATG
jgi:hypothetical protein